MGQRGTVKKKGRTVLEKRRSRREQQGTEVKRTRKGERFNTAS